MNKSRIAVVGMGYIGNHLYSYLKSIRSIGNFELSFYNKSTLNEIVNKEFDFVFNCAGNTGDFKNNIWATVSSNLVLNHFLLEHVDIKKALVLLSSTRIYGSSNEAKYFFHEDANIMPINTNHLDIDFIYNGTKMLSESVAINLSRSLNYNIVICRLSNLYGKFLRSDLNDSTYLKLMLRYKMEGRTLLVNQNIDSTKPFVYIDDAIQGIILAAIKSTKSDVYNISSGESYSIKNWLDFLGLSYERNESNVMSIFCNVAIDKAKTELGFDPCYFLQELSFDQIFTE
ncbi:MAG: NAD(P)-dependent oxidoreductase [Saprospiraceae bacterium]|nr:NAD(P)-dependent oxidoreductase [Candidatus Defluviibacterium haderslevense]